MRILVMGTGALGGYFGGLLARANNDVTFIMRGPRLDRARSDGLRIESTASGSFTIAGAFTDDAATAGVVDLVLFCVKSYDTPAGIHAIRPCIGPETAILPLQNGVENEEMLADAFGADKILAGAARIEATVEDDGTIRQIGANQRIDFGEWSDNAPPERGPLLLEVLRAAGVDARLTNDARLELWRKFIFLCSTAALTAATDRSIGEIVAMPETHAVLERAIREIAALARAEGVGLPDDIVASQMQWVEGLPHQMRSSLQRDLARGRRVEIDALSGSVVRRGRMYGVDTPVHETLWACVKARAEGRNSNA